MFISKKELNRIKEELDAHQDMIANLAVNLTRDKMDLEERINKLAKIIGSFQKRLPKKKKYVSGN